MNREAGVVEDFERPTMEVNVDGALVLRRVEYVERREDGSSRPMPELRSGEELMWVCGQSAPFVVKTRSDDEEFNLRSLRGGCDHVYPEDM